MGHTCIYSYDHLRTAKRKRHSALFLPSCSPGGYDSCTLHQPVGCSYRYALCVCAGSFADKVARKTAAATSLASSVADQIAIRQSETKTQSHTSGFEVSNRAWASHGLPPGMLLQWPPYRPCLGRHAVSGVERPQAAIQPGQPQAAPRTHGVTSAYGVQSCWRQLTTKPLRL